MRLHQHIIASGAISAGIYGITRSPVVALTSFVAGFIIDLDHLIDYWRAYPFSMNVRHFFRTCEGYELKNLILILHSWELLFLVFVFTYMTRSAITLGIALGAAQHLLFDQVSNFVHPLSYFFTYRCLHGFHSESVFDLPPAMRESEEAHGHD